MQGLTNREAVLRKKLDFGGFRVGNYIIIVKHFIPFLGDNVERKCLLNYKKAGLLINFLLKEQTPP